MRYRNASPEAAACGGSRNSLRMPRLRTAAASWPLSQPLTILQLLHGLVACRCAVDALQQAAPHATIVIYVREGVTAEQLVQEADSRFNVRLRRPIQVRCVCCGFCTQQAAAAAAAATPAAHADGLPSALCGINKESKATGSSCMACQHTQGQLLAHLMPGVCCLLTTDAADPQAHQSYDHHSCTSHACWLHGLCWPTHHACAGHASCLPCTAGPAPQAHQPHPA